MHLDGFLLEYSSISLLTLSKKHKKHPTSSYFSVQTDHVCLIQAHYFIKKSVANDKNIAFHYIICFFAMFIHHLSNRIFEFEFLYLTTYLYKKAITFTCYQRVVHLRKLNVLSSSNFIHTETEKHT